MYVGRKHTAVRSAEVERTFCCKGCGYSSPVRVTGIGEGTGNSPYFLDGDGARRRAVDEATARASEDADVVLAIVPCPSCGERDPAAARAFKTKGLLATLGLLALGCAIGVVLAALMSHRSGSMGLVFGVGTGVLSASAGIYVDRAKRSATWDGAILRVSFPSERDGA
ncbi:MAG: hypothetical protein KIS78_00030 [Labilithrix sp.]|nr:hypothetical protein [Labilithrix sp.]MCW5830826.1 hypothetical protein [Labilithrix sp.]